MTHPTLSRRLTFSLCSALLTYLCICTLALTPSSQLSAEDNTDAENTSVTIVSDGAATAVILLSTTPHDYEQWAATELITHVTALSGAILTTHNVATADPATTAILIGNDLVIATYPEEQACLDSLTMDGIVIKTKGKHLLLFGHGTRGTLFAAYEFLDMQGIRWFTPETTLIPKKQTISFPATDTVYSPQIWLREYLVHQGPTEHKHVHNAHNRLNKLSWDLQENKYGGGLKFYHKPHNLKALFLKSRNGMTSDFKTHPEMWALSPKKGKKEAKRHQAQVCLTNENIYKLFLANTKNYFKNNPDAEFLMVGQEDNWKYCQCDTCAALTKKHHTPAAPMVALLNRLATGIENDYPDKNLRFFAYQWSQKPPVDMPMNKKLIVYLAPIQNDFCSPIEQRATRENKEFCDDLTGWSAIAQEIHLWNYNTCFRGYFIPWPNLHAMIKDLKFYAQHHVTGVFNEASHRTPHSDFKRLRAWVVSRAMWNPEKDTGEEFVRGYYGAAADDILAYIDIIHHVADTEVHSMKIISSLATSVLPPDSIAKGYQALERAAKSVADNQEMTARLLPVRAGVDMVLVRRGRNSETFKQTAALCPQFTYAAAADRLNKVKKITSARLFSQKTSIKSVLNYVQSVKNKSAADMIPKELAGVNYTAFFQAGQLDARMNFLKKVPAASDGWALCLPVKVPMNAHTITPSLGHYDPSKPFTIHYRIRPHTLVKDAKKTAFLSTVFYGERILGKWSMSIKKFSAGDLVAGKWQTVSWTPTFKEAPTEEIRIVFTAQTGAGVGKNKKTNAPADIIDLDYFYITQD